MAFDSYHHGAPLWLVHLLALCNPRLTLILTDEIVQLILYQLPNPTSLTLVSKHFYEISRDPYVRAHYFLVRHGNLYAMYWALGRGRVLTNRVIDVCSFFVAVPLTTLLNPMPPSLDSPELWGDPFPVPDSSSRPPLLSYHLSSLHQNNLGSLCAFSRIHAFSQSCSGNLRRNPPCQGRG